MNHNPKRLISIIILFIAATLIIPACNISDHPTYTQGSGALLKDSDHKPSILQDFNQFKEIYLQAFWDTARVGCGHGVYSRAENRPSGFCKYKQCFVLYGKRGLQGGV
jgi:hypothetical protein